MNWNILILESGEIQFFTYGQVQESHFFLLGNLIEQWKENEN